MRIGPGMIVARALAAALAFAAAPAQAEPHVPASDQTVLERLPEAADPSLRELKRWRVVLAKQPGNEDFAIRYARRAIEASRASGDPRFLGQAQAALQPWWASADAPAAIAVLRATIRQSMHEFGPALSDLDGVLVREPENVQARLTRASVLTVVGRYADARRDCAHIAGRVAEIVATTCLAAVGAVDGETQHALARLDLALGSTPRLPPAIGGWSESVAGDIARRLGRDGEAEAHWRRALALDPDDAYVRSALSELLLATARAREAAGLVSGRERNDILLLRLALAEQRFASTASERASFERHAGELAARFAALRARGDVVHRREEARFALEIERDARRALGLALANWEVQREPADADVLWDAAQAVGDPRAARLVSAWRDAHGWPEAARAKQARS